MKRDHLHDPDDDFKVEITSLDMPEMPVNNPVSFMRTPKIRAWLTILSIITGLTLVIIVLSTVLPSLLPSPQKRSPPPAPTTYSLNTEVINGVAYVILSDGMLHALRTRDGSQLWQSKLPITAVVRATIVNSINNSDTLYIRYTDENGVFIQALRTKDGALLWTSNPFPFDNSLLVINNGISYLLSGPIMQGRTLDALNNNNGSTLWQYSLNSHAILGPYTSIQVHIDKTYISTLLTPGKQILFVLSNSDGSLLWRYDYPNTQQANGLDSPFIQNNLIYIIANDGATTVLRTDNGHIAWHYRPAIHNVGNIAVNAPIVTSIEGGVLKVLRASDGALLWTYKNPVGVFNVLSVTDDIVYVGTNDGTIIALQINDGKQLWHARPAFPSFIPASLSVADGTVYVPAMTSLVTQEITLYALRTSDGTLLWQHDMGASDAELQQVSNGLVFASAGNLSLIKILRARDGAQLWQSLISAPLSQNNGAFAQSNISFAIAGGVTLLRSPSGLLEAHQSGTGAVLWRYPHISS